jgi:hypothetical protein
MNVRKPLVAALLASALWIEACAIPAWVNTVESDAQVAAPIAASLIDVIDPSLAPVVTLVENGFNALAKTLDTYKASPTATHLQAVQAAFAAVNSNVAQLESAGQIKNATTQTTVTAVVGLLTQAVTEIGALVPAGSGLEARDTGQATAIPNSGLQIPNGPQSPTPQTAGARIPKGWKAKDFKEQFNKIIKGDPRFRPLK